MWKTVKKNTIINASRLKMGCILCYCFRHGEKEESPHDGSEQCGAGDIKSGESASDPKTENCEVEKSGTKSDPQIGDADYEVSTGEAAKSGTQPDSKIGDSEKVQAIIEEAVRKEECSGLVSSKFK